MKKLLLLLTLGVLLASCGGESESAMRTRLEAQLKDSLARAGQAATSVSNSNEVPMTTETEGKNLVKANRRIDYSSNSHAKIESFKEIISTRKLTEEDIAGLNDDELSLLNNLAYAIHGYKFTQPRYRNFFEGYDWYTPTTSNPRLNSVEQANSKFVRSHMDKR